MKPRLLLKICCENIIIITYNISLSQKKKKKTYNISHITISLKLSH